MKRQRSAGAVVVSTDLKTPHTLLLDQVRHNGERQTVAAKGRIEPGESPLAAARREVTEETSVDALLYAGYLGQESYDFTDRDGTPGDKTVDWFLFATDSSDAAPQVDEGFHQARWVALDQSEEVATHPAFRRFLDQAADIGAWRNSVGFSRPLSGLIWELCEAASTILDDEPGAAVALCGSAARGDFVDGWSDIDLVGSGIGRAAADQLDQLTRRLTETHGLRCSLRFADTKAVGPRGPGALRAMKLRGAFARAGVDVAVIAGTGQLPRPDGPVTDDLAAAVAACHAFAVHRLADLPTSQADRVDRARRSLSVLTTAVRLLITAQTPAGPLRLSNVVDFLEKTLPATQATGVLADYDRIRREGAVADLTCVDTLAEQVPAALDEIGRYVADRRPGTAATQPPRP